MREHADIFEFVGVGELAETLTQFLSLNLIYHSQTTPGARRRTGGLEQMERLILQQAKDHLAKVREGFVLSVRTTQVNDKNELRYLLDRVLLDWEQLSRELGLDSDDAADQAPSNATSNATSETTSDVISDATPELTSADTDAVERIRHQLLAYSMAAVAIGHLPRLPSRHITFPHSYGDPPTYADIAAPDTPGEMLWRIEELEEMIWQIMVHDLHELAKHKYGPLRRTYGYFEASAWLARKEAERFGIKKQQSNLVFF